MQYRVRIRSPANAEAASCVSFEPTSGTLEPFGTARVDVSVSAAEDDESTASEVTTVELCVEDEGLLGCGPAAAAAAARVVSVDFEYDSAEVVKGLLQSGRNAFRSGVGSALPVVGLVGPQLISASSNRYEINWGQENAHPGQVERTLQLEYLGDREGGPLHYRIVTLPDDDSAWIQVSPYSLLVNPYP